MARDYGTVLKALQVPFRAIGRGQSRAARLQSELGMEVTTGGVEDALARTSPPSVAIVAVGIAELAECTRVLLERGVSRLLIEKPGFGAPAELKPLVELALSRKAVALLAYNRRFYSSVQRARQLIAGEGGVTSFHFDFTEWSHQISQLDKSRVEWENWFFGNSSHLLDLAFFLGGAPQELHSQTAGQLSWHPTSAVFAGSGKTDQGALFSYLADWTGPGRWGLELITPKSRLIFRPIEKLSRMEIGSVAISEVALGDELDQLYKPGLYRQTQAFLEGRHQDFLSLQDQLARLPMLCKIGGFREP